MSQRDLAGFLVVLGAFLVVGWLSHGLPTALRVTGSILTAIAAWALIGEPLKAWRIKKASKRRRLSLDEMSYLPGLPGYMPWAQRVGSPWIVTTILFAGAFAVALGLLLET